MFTIEQLQALYTTTKQDVISKYYNTLVSTMQAAGIDTRLRICAFLAQVGHESGCLNIVQENLNYSADGLLKIFPKYFPTRELADQYARQPEKIANYVYGNRLGNGGPETGDGWRFRGRGLIQITGKENYINFAKDNNLSLKEVVDFLETSIGACTSATWYWTKRNINQAADKDDIVLVTKLVNGGTNGLQHRTELYEKAKILIP